MLPTPATTPTKKGSTSQSTPSSMTAIPSQRYTNIYDHATSLLSTSAIFDTASAALPFLGREKEMSIITSFLASRFDPTTSTSSRPSLYISGPPGIGKTASLVTVLSTFTQEQDEEVKVHMENCSSIGSIGMETSMWNRFGVGLKLWSSKMSGKRGREDFDNGMRSSGLK